MSIELVFTPSGHLATVDTAAQEPAGATDESSDDRSKKLVKAFASGQSQGLLMLAAQRFEVAPTSSLAYWRDFAGRYLTELCHIPQTTGAEIDAIEPPDPAELAASFVAGRDAPDRRRRGLPGMTLCGRRCVAGWV